MNAELVARVQAGDRAAEAEILAANEGLVWRVVKRFSQPEAGLEREDLLQEGRLGLLLAAWRFNPAAGYQFSTYATVAIQRRVVKALGQDAVIRLPEHILEAERARARERDAAGEPPPEGRPVPRVTTSLEVAVDEDGTTLADMMPDPGAVAWEERTVDALDAAAQLGPWLETLSALERAVIERRFGLGGRSEETLAEIAAALGCSREGVRQMQHRALLRLRRAAGVLPTTQMDLPLDAEEEEE